MVSRPVTFIANSGQKWLGEHHPVFVKMHRTLAEYYMDFSHFYSKALSHASESLEMQQILNQGDSEWMWKDYYLIGKIHALNRNYEPAFPFLQKAKELVITDRLKDYEHYGEMILSISKTYHQLGNYR
jgi:tetratricopeptide (TPR) repeat protein